LHDIYDLDGRGIAGTAVATVEFQEAAAAQAKAQAFEPSLVYVANPIQPLTEAELADLADDAIEPILRAITGAA
jgi:hypothetical protein